jgi:hypothetical protein
MAKPRSAWSHGSRDRGIAAAYTGVRVPVTEATGGDRCPVMFVVDRETAAVGATHWPVAE